MAIYRLHIFSLFSLLLLSVEAGARVWINEIMQSNVYEVYEKDVHEFPDSYIELYNDSDEEIGLFNYSIGLTPNYEESHPIPIMPIAPRGYVMLYPDKMGIWTHPNFRLDSGKGTIYLFLDEKVIDVLTHPKQPCPNVSYGRLPSNFEKLGYFAEATPGKENPFSFADGIAPEILFSKEGGAWKKHNPFELELFPKDSIENYEIRYTTDGSEPTRKSKIYTSPIKIENTTVIRAKCFKENFAPRPSSVQSYIFHGKDITMPVVSLVIEPDYLYGEEGLMNLLSIEIRKPLNVEYFPLKGREDTRVVNQLCEAKLGGQYTKKKNPLKSFILYANKRFGKKRFSYSFWNNMKPNIEEAKSIYLRRGLQPQFPKSTILRDQVCIAAGARFMDSITYQAFDNVIVYLNGEFYGMDFLYERTDDGMLEDNYGVDKDNYDVYKVIGAEWYCASGNENEFKKFREFMNSEHTMDEWRSMMNVESFINLFLMQDYAGNWDFIYNNYKMYCNREEEHPRWSFFSFDCDEAFRKFFYYGFLPWANGDFEKDNLHSLNEDETILFRNLMKNEEFRESYVRHFVAYHGDFLNKENFLAVADSLYDISRNEMQHTIDKHGFDIKPLGYHKRRLDVDIDKRDRYIKYEIQDFFHLGEPVRVVVNKFNNNLDDYKLSYDSIPLHRNYFDGIDYEGRMAKITAYSISNDAYIRKWKITKSIGGKKYESVVEAKGDTLALDIEKGVSAYIIYPWVDSAEENDYLMDEELGIGEMVNVYSVDGRFIKRYTYLGDKPNLSSGVYIFTVEGKRSRSWKHIVW